MCSVWGVGLGGFSGVFFVVVVCYLGFSGCFFIDSARSGKGGTGKEKKELKFSETTESIQTTESLYIHLSQWNDDPMPIKGLCLRKRHTSRDGCKSK